MGAFKTLYFDTETFSDIPLRRGHHAYFEGASEIMVAQWAIDDAPVIVEDLTQIRRDGSVRILQPSDELIEHLLDADQIVIQNAAFDMAATEYCWDLPLDIERVHCTMAQAMSHSLPGSMGKLCEIMGVDADEAKDANGQRLIRLFCMPQPKNFKLRRATKATHPQEWEEFLHYAKMDIPSMRALRRKLPKWNYRDTNEHQEKSLWMLDYKINRRGFLVDTDLAHKAISTIAREQKSLAAKTWELTQGEVEKATKRDDLLIHIFVEYGVYLPDLKKDTLERQLENPELPDALKQLIRLRLATSTSSTAKYTALKNSVSSDGRLRGTTAFCGAIRTGRWGGRIFQPQNMPRPDMEHADIEAAIEALQANCLDLVTDDVMRSLSNILRGLIIASPGRKLVAADLEQIESRVAAWLAGEQWKLDAIADYDAGRGFDNYVWAYARAFGVTPEAVVENKKRNGWWRQVGKVMELAQAYEGGVGAWLAFAMVYRLNLDVLAEDAYPRLPQAARDQAEIMWAWREQKKITTFGLARKTFVVIEAFKSLWRKAHPATSDYWPALNKAAIDAVQNPGTEVSCGKISFLKTKAWLQMILPSGRMLCYPSPKVQAQGGKETLTYMGVNQYTRKWQRISTYGGKLFENATQATARDVMAYAMPKIEAAGYRILLTVHDEVITEPLDKPGFTSANLCEILAANPPWLEGCPLAAGGFEAQRYRKD